MKVKHLAIISFDSENAEIKACVEALAKRNAAKPRTLSVIHVAIGSNGCVKKFDCFRSCAPAAHDCGLPRDYGAYVVFHYTAELACVLLGDWADGLKDRQCAVGVADRFAAVTFAKLRFPRLGKVCLVACGMANPGNEPAAFGDYFCEQLVTACGTYNVLPPLVAGWDCFVTVSAPDNSAEELKEKFRKPEDSGRKVSSNQQGNRRAWGNVARDWHKKVWVYEGGRYVKKQLTETDWHDAVEPHATTDGKVAIIT